MTNDDKAKMIADQCQPCTEDFYMGVYQGVLIALNAEDENVTTCSCSNCSCK